MVQSKVIRLHFQEGPIENYFRLLQNEYGGETKGCEYLLITGPLKANISSYNLMGEIEMSLLTFQCSKRLVIDREPDQKPNYIHLNIITEGAFKQLYEKETAEMQLDTPKGIFLYNGLFPISVEVDANKRISMILFKLDYTALNKTFTDSQEIFEELFKDQIPLAYHTSLSRDIEKLIKDLFQFTTLSYGSKAMVLSRGIEVFTNLVYSFKKLKDKNKLNSLHADDYKRLQQIKSHLLTTFDEKITIESLASNYGISASKLKRDFKTLFNCSVYQFYSNSRMDEAYRRLKSGKHSVSEVGYDLGYHNLSKFSEMFKKIKGISPKEVNQSPEI